MSSNLYTMSSNSVKSPQVVISAESVLDQLSKLVKNQAGFETVTNENMRRIDQRLKTIEAALVKHIKESTTIKP